MNTFIRKNALMNERMVKVRDFVNVTFTVRRFACFLSSIDRRLCYLSLISCSMKHTSDNICDNYSVY